MTRLSVFNQTEPVPTRDPSFNVRYKLARQHSYRETPGVVLEQLATDENEQIRMQVAQNVHTPIGILLQLANDTSVNVKKGLLKNPNTPVTILTRLGLEEDLVDVRNPNTPGDVLAHVVRKMLQSADYRRDEKLVKFLKHPVKGTQMPAEVLLELASHHNTSVRYRVADHPNTPVAALEKLAREANDDPPITRAIASHASTPPDLLEQLATHPDLTTCLNVVNNPNTSATVFAQIVQNAQTTQNAPNRTKDTLKSAIAGSHYDVLRNIASRSQTPLHALELLARREFTVPSPEPQSFVPSWTADDVLKSLAHNPSLDSAILEILTQDTCEEVRVILVRHPNLTLDLWQRLAQDESVAVRQAIASSLQTPPPVLAILGRDKALDVQQALAANPNSSIETLNQLATLPDILVRKAVASNSSTSKSIIEQLATDDSVDVRRAVAENPHTPTEVRALLHDLVAAPTFSPISPTLAALPRRYNPKSDDLPELLREYAQADNAFVRLAAFLHPLTPVDVLEDGVRSPFWLERYAIAENPAATETMRQVLAQDANRLVRVCAHKQ